MWGLISTWSEKGTPKRQPREQVALAVRVLDNRHHKDVLERSQDILGDRANIIGPIDLSRNVLGTWSDRVCRTYTPPPFVGGLEEGLALVMGDVSASVTVDRYAKAGGRPYPSTAALASAEAQRYEQGAGYAGVAIGYSARQRRLTLTVISPDDLTPTYLDDEPDEPTVIDHKCTRAVDGQQRTVHDVYDLTDIKAPSFKVLLGEEDVTARALGRSYSGDAWPMEWRYADGTPFHPIVMRGHRRHIYRRSQQLEASLIVPVRWTAWGSGTDHSSHPARNVRGLRYIGSGSNAANGETGASSGPETVHRWADHDPERPGDHWQDSPAFDPLTTARAIGFYETLTLSLVDLPVQFDSTGGEPMAREAEALEERILGTYAESRRFDGELLRRCAAVANGTPEIEGSGYSEGPYGCLYRGEIAEALASVRPSPAPVAPGAPPEETPDEEGDDA